MASSERRPSGSGSIFYAKTRQHWVFMDSVQIRGRRTRRAVVRKTYDDLILALRELERRESVALIDHRDDRSKRAQRKAAAADFIERVLTVAEVEHWERAFTVRVLVAALSARRVRLNVFGPCAYCGDWMADTVDHSLPRVHGGTDDPANLVSACTRCNSEKQARLDYAVRSA